MKNIVVCCDGTWNTPDFREGTNVWKLYLAMPVNSEEQVKYYDTGVGTQGLIDKLTGGLTGKGLVDNIFEAYRFICLHYEAGDKIFIFGFSRGAYTARALSSVLADIGVLQFGAKCSGAHFKDHYRSCFDNQTISESNDRYDLNILCDCCRKTYDNINLVKEAFKAYKKQSYKNAKAHIKQNKSLPEIDHEELKKKILEDHKQDNWTTIDAEIEMLGVWDTVSALGIPSLADVVRAHGSWKKKLMSSISNFLFKSSRNEYAFINNQLNHSVSNGYHALALDEKRDMFKPVLWDDNKMEHQHIEQVWFIGAHSNVGGGYLDHSLSDIALHWMMEKAEKHHIIFDKGAVSTRPNYLGMLNHSHKDGLFNYLPHSYRHLPQGSVLHESVYKRIYFSPHYVPKNVYKTQ